VDLSLAAGVFAAVMGPSGSGKSTLLHCAAGLDVPDGGAVHLGDLEVSSLGEAARARLRRDRVGFVFQAFNLVPALSAGQNVGLPLRLGGRRPRPGQVSDALAAVGLADRSRRRPDQLSGGQQQRVAIARALVHRPSVLFADEPTGALDSGTARQVLDLLAGMADQGTTVVMVTHDPVAAARASQVLFLSDGRLVGRLDDPTVEGVALRLAALEVGGEVAQPAAMGGL
jgi:putative ABC transport system ATP-binding protein